MFNHRLIVAGMALLVAIPCSASIVTYTTSAAFDAATTGVDTFQNISFDPNLGQSFNIIDIAGVDFVGAGSNPALTVLANPGGSWPSGAVLARSSGGGSITIIFTTDVRAFSLYTSDVSFGQINATVTTASGSFSWSPSSNPSVPFFIGVTTDEAITSLTLGTFSNFDRPDLGGLRVGTPSMTEAETPEVATLLLIGTGLGLLRYLRRWKRPVHAA